MFPDPEAVVDAPGHVAVAEDTPSQGTHMHSLTRGAFSGAI